MPYNAKNLNHYFQRETIVSESYREYVSRKKAIKLWKGAAFLSLFNVVAWTYAAQWGLV